MKWIPILTILMIVPSRCPAADDLIPEAKITLTSTFNGLVSDPKFVCEGRIHGYITLPEKISGNHRLESNWVLPNGEIKEHFETELRFNPPGRQTAYVWLEFNSQADGMLSSLESSAINADRKSLDGQWEVDIILDGNTLIEKSFIVICN